MVQYPISEVGATNSDDDKNTTTGYEGSSLRQAVGRDLYQNLEQKHDPEDGHEGEPSAQTEQLHLDAEERLLDVSSPSLPFAAGKLELDQGPEVLPLRLPPHYLESRLTCNKNCTSAERYF